MIVGFVAYLSAALLLLSAYTAPAGALAGFMVFYINRRWEDDGKKTLRGGLYSMLGTLGLLPGLAWLAVPLMTWLAFSSKGGGAMWPPVYHLGIWIVTAAGSGMVALLLLRAGTQILDKTASKLTAKTKLERNKKTDIRSIDDFLPKTPKDGLKYDPRQYFNQHKGMFVGLNEERQPIYIEHEDWLKKHISLVGGTRLGKGVSAQTLLYQAVKYGEFVVILDPKADEWMPHVFKQACDESGLPNRLLDLRQHAPEQTNIFYGGDIEALENTLIGGFSLTEKGSEGDHYRLSDRKAARQAAKWLVAHPNATPRDLLLADAEAADGLPGGWAETAKNLHACLEEIAEIDALNHPGGDGFLDFTDGEKNGGVLYVIGDLVNTRILRAQKMILLRLLFLAKQRGYAAEGEKKKRPIAVLADEFRVHISNPFMVSLQASAGWGLHSILAFQSFKDLAQCPIDLDKDAVKGSVMENCQIKLCYAIEDADTREEFARNTGTMQADDEMRKVKKNLVLSETVDGDRTLRQTERFYFDGNILQSMKVGCAALKLPQRLVTFCLTSPVPIKKNPAALIPTGHPPATPAGFPAESPALTSFAAQALSVGTLQAAVKNVDYPFDLPEAPSAD